MINNPPATGNIYWHLPAAGFSFTYVEHASAELAEHSHARPSLNLILSGMYAEDCSGYEGDFPAGSLLFKPANAAHANRSTQTKSRSLIIEVTSDTGQQAGFEAYEKPWQRFYPPMTSLTQRLFCELTISDSDSRLGVESLCREVFSLGQGGAVGTGRKPRWLPAVEDRLSLLDRSPPTLTELADLAGVCPTHLARAFRQHTAATPGEYLRARRIAFVLDRLIAAFPVDGAELAARAGFADQSHMIRTFRRVTGWTPAALRASLSQR
jgi:AraC family transcriptional regulator